MYEMYQERMEDRDSKLRAKKARKDYEADEWEGFSEDNKSDDEEEQEEDDSDAELSADTVPKPGNLSNHASMFFDQDLFQGIEEEEEEEDDDDDEEEDDSEEEENEDDEEEAEEDGEIEEEEAVPAPTSKAKNKKEPKEQPKKKQESEWIDSDEEIEEPEDPRKANGQLGKLLSLPFSYPFVLSLISALQTSILLPPRLWPSHRRWLPARRRLRMWLTMAGTAIRSAMSMVFQSGSLMTKESIAKSNGPLPRPPRLPSRRSCVLSTPVPSRR